MSHLNYFNDINNMLSFDSNLKGQMPRWQKKLDATNTTHNGSINTSKQILSVSFNNSLANVNMNTNNNKTPVKGVEQTNGKRTPGKSPGNSFVHTHYYPLS